MCKEKGSAEPPARHPYKVWATHKEGFEQIGCIYSAQGFEFDYVGVIIGRDLRWDNVTKTWVGDLSKSQDRGFKQGLSGDAALIQEKLRNIYRVLCTRGMKGTYLYFLDEATKQRFIQMGAERWSV